MPMFSLCRLRSKWDCSLLSKYYRKYCAKVRRPGNRKKACTRWRKKFGPRRQKEVPPRPSGGAGSQLARELVALPGAKNFSRMLDLGGGYGVFSLYAATPLPSLKVQVFDSPAVLKVAKQYIEEYSLQERVSILPGNYPAETLDDGYDLIPASCTLNLTLAERTTGHVVRKIIHTLKPRGYFVSLHDSRPDFPEANPLFPVEYPVYSMLSGAPVNMPRGFIASLALEADFKQYARKNPASTQAYLPWT